MGAGGSGGLFSGTKGSKSSSNKNSRFIGKPGEIKREGNIETHIGANGKADFERHYTDHGNSKYHTNPHDHKINWDRDGNPIFSKAINKKKD